MADSQASRDGDSPPGRRYCQQTLLNIMSHLRKRVTQLTDTDRKFFSYLFMSVFFFFKLT